MYTYVPRISLIPPLLPPLLPPVQVIAEHPAELPVLHCSFPLPTYLTHGSAYMSVPVLTEGFWAEEWPICDKCEEDFGCEWQADL